MSSPAESGSRDGAPSVTRRVLAGSLEEVDIFGIAQFLIIQRKTGTLRITSGSTQAGITFAKGQMTNASLPNVPDGLPALRKIFTWKEGAFEFAPMAEPGPPLITDDAQSLLMDLAVEIDEAGWTPPPAATAPPPVTSAPPTGVTPPVHPAVVRVVRPAGPPQPPLAARIGSAPVTPVASQPVFARRAFSQEEFVRQIEERLVIQETELPAVPRDVLRRQFGARREATRLPVAFLAIGIPSLLVIAGFVAFLATRTTPSPSPPSSPTTAPSAPPAAASQHKFVTALGSRERMVEQCIADLPYRCRLTSVGFDPKDARQVNVRLTREVFWDKTELATAIAIDSVAVVEKIFASRKDVERVYIVAQTRLDPQSATPKLDEVFKMLATRSIYEGLKFRYATMAPLGIVEHFGGRFHPKFAGP
jgi:hypothetical protein